jgi:hypothetical protein
VAHACNPSTQKAEQEDGKFEATLGWAYSEILSKTKKKAQEQVMWFKRG